MTKFMDENDLADKLLKEQEGITEVGVGEDELILLADGTPVLDTWHQLKEDSPKEYRRYIYTFEKYKTKGKWVCIYKGTNKNIRDRRVKQNANGI